jgi:hypothetical protein
MDNVGEVLLAKCQGARAIRVIGIAEEEDGSIKFGHEGDYNRWQMD